MSDEVAKSYYQGLEEDFLLCRSYGHMWRPYTVNFAGGHYYVRVICHRCGTFKVDTLTSTGKKVRTRMEYPLGYKKKGGGLLGTRGIAKLTYIERQLGFEKE